MGLLRQNNKRFLVFLFSLGLVAGSVQGCDKGLAEKLETKKDERFAEAAERLSNIAKLRHDVSTASKLMLETAENPLLRRTLRARPNPVDRVLGAIEALRGSDKEVTTKYVALGRLESRAKVARAQSETNALAHAVEKITSADSLETIKNSRQNLNFEADYQGRE